MRSVNMVVLIGHLTRDPELRQTPSGQSVATFSIATNRRWTTADNQQQEETNFHDLVAWGKLAEICDQYLNKGTAVYIRGRLNNRSWEAQDGSKRHKTEIVVEDLNILSPRRSGEGEGADEAFASTTITKESEVNAADKSKKETAGAATGAAVTGSEEINVEDIPF